MSWSTWRRKLNVSSFFMMDENFLLNRQRAMQLLARMKQAGKSWSMYVFSSANAIRRYSMEELVQLGVSWIWLGLESPKSSYAKLRDTDTQDRSGDRLSRGSIYGQDIRRENAAMTEPPPASPNSTAIAGPGAASSRRRKIIVRRAAILLAALAALGATPAMPDFKPPPAPDPVHEYNTNPLARSDDEKYINDVFRTFWR